MLVQTGKCSRCEGFEVSPLHPLPCHPRHLQLSSSVIAGKVISHSELHPSLLWSWNECWERMGWDQGRNLCKAQSWGSLEHDCFSFNFGCHITVVLFHRWRPVGTRDQRGPAWDHTASWILSLAKAHPWLPDALHPVCPLNPLFFRQKTSQISMEKQHSSHCLLVTWIPGNSGECSSPSPSFAPEVLCLAAACRGITRENMLVTFPLTSFLWGSPFSWK